MTEISLANRVAYALANGDKEIPVKLSAPGVKGNAMKYTVAGVASAPANNDRLGPICILTQAGSTDDIVKAIIKGPVQAKSGTTFIIGSLLDASSDLEVDALATQTNGNGFARALEAAATAGDLVWVNIL